jgi:hypothetical protein
MPATLNRANTDLVTVALIQAILGQSGGVGAKLPGDAASWAKTGFVQIVTVGGTPNVYAPLRRPVVDVRAKWITPNSKQPDWFAANALAERILAGLWGQSGEPREVVLPAGFERAFVQSAYALTEPRRIGGDDSSIATYQFDMQINWVPGGVG